jgi:hypothetical protein
LLILGKTVCAVGFQDGQKVITVKFTDGSVASLVAITNLDRSYWGMMISPVGRKNDVEWFDASSIPLPNVIVRSPLTGSADRSRVMVVTPQMPQPGAGQGLMRHALFVALHWIRKTGAATSAIS